METFLELCSQEGVLLPPQVPEIPTGGLTATTQSYVQAQPTKQSPFALAEGESRS